jgi:imidazolonepropionase-like amidohydrolase
MTQQPSLEIRDVTLIDGTGAPARAGVSVLIRGEEIAAIAEPGAAAGAGAGAAEVIDGRGRHLIPGLWETQAHTCDSGARHRTPWYIVPPGGRELIAENLRTYLRRGITTVVDLGGRTDVLIEARSAQRQGTSAGARLLLSGAHFNWPAGAFIAPWMNRLVGSVAEARAEAERALTEERVDILKVVFSHGDPANPLGKMSPEVLRAIVECGHAHGVPSAVHADSAGDILAAVAVGVDSPEHMFAPQGTGWREDRSRVIEAINGAGAYWPLSITLFEAEAHARDGAWLQAHAGEVPQELLEVTQNDPESLWRTLSDRDRDDAAARLDAALETALAAHKAGVRMTISSDSGVCAIFHGIGTLREMELHEQAGVPNLAILTMATKHAADKLGHGQRLGTIEVGKIADLVLLDADPLASIANLRKIHTVIQGGKPLGPRDLAASG